MQTYKTLIRAALPLCAALLAVVPQVTHAEDASVKRRLDARGVKYKIDRDGDFRMVQGYRDSGRSQSVYVAGISETVGSLSVRKIFSPAAVLSRNPLNGAKALELLASSSTKKLGAWEIRDGILFMVMKLPDNISAVDLQVAIDAVAAVADDMELKLTGKDDL